MILVTAQIAHEICQFLDALGCKAKNVSLHVAILAHPCATRHLNILFSINDHFLTLKWRISGVS